MTTSRTARLLHDFVREHAREQGSALAVTASDGSVSYAELDAEADRFAGRLAALGVSRGDRVALWLPKSTVTIAVMQAVLRLGAAYVPIDPLSPPDRAAKVIRDCTPRVVVATPDGSRMLRAESITTTVLPVAPNDPETRRHDGVAPPPPDPRVGADELAYILYTSGSTGNPKGVRISHRNALAFVEWAAAELGAGPADRFANHAPLHFDLSVLDLYVAFLAGASVHLIPHESGYAPARLVELLTERRITVWYSVPSALILMARDGGLLESRPPCLRAILFAGEPYPVDHLRRLRDHLPDIRLLNLYGPTETNVCTFYEVTALPAESARPVPIGKACSGDKVWVARADGTPADPGEEGELMVDGPTVMLGYHGQPPQAGRPYATGDRVLLADDGNFEYLGRRDSMVKIRGYRVELGEIEAALQRHPDVSEVVVAVRGTGMDARLVAYVVPVAGRSLSLLEAKRHCAGLVPRHMIVDLVEPLANLPRTVNGKVDRRILAR